MADQTVHPESDTTAEAGAASALHHVPVEITVAVGTARPSIGELLRLEQGEVLVLDRKIDDPVELFVGDRLIARGQLEERSDGAGLTVRLTEIADIQSGL